MALVSETHELYRSVGEPPLFCNSIVELPTMIQGRVETIPLQFRSIPNDREHQLQLMPSCQFSLLPTCPHRTYHPNPIWMGSDQSTLTILIRRDMPACLWCVTAERALHACFKVEFLWIYHGSGLSPPPLNGIRRLMYNPLWAGARFLAQPAASFLSS